MKIKKHFLPVGAFFFGLESVNFQFHVSGGKRYPKRRVPVSSLES